MEMREIEGYPNYLVDEYSKVWSIKYQKYLSPCISKCGYYGVSLYCSVKQKGKTFQSHRLAAIVFVPNPDSKPCVNHIDGDKLNNHISNFEWVTFAENNKHAYVIGLKVVSDKVREVAKKGMGARFCGKNSYKKRELIHVPSGKTFYTIREAAEFYGHNESTLGKRLMGKEKNLTGLEYRY